MNNPNAYNNLMHVVAGEVAAAAGGASYEELMRREIFGLLGMTRCQVGAWDRDGVGNVAQPHMRQGDGNVAISSDGERIPLDTAAPAGGIRCGLNDMLTWIRVWLGDELKTSDGMTWLSPTQRRELWSAHTPMPCPNDNACGMAVTSTPMAMVGACPMSMASGGSLTPAPWRACIRP